MTPNPHPWNRPKTADTITPVHEPSARSDAAYAPHVDPSSVASGACPLRGWRPTPGELVSLRDMLRFNAHAFVSLTAMLRQMEATMEGIRSHASWQRGGQSVNDLLANSGGTGEDQEFRDWLHKMWASARATCERLLDKTEEHCKELCLEQAPLMVARVRKHLEANARLCKAGQWEDVFRRLNELADRIEDELTSRMFFAVPPGKAKYHLDAHPFGEEVEAKLPRCVEDIAEASKCIGFGRWTAAVFHLMRVMEAGVQLLISRLGLGGTVSLAQPWGALLPHIDRAVNALPGGPNATDAQRAKKSAFSEAAVFLRHVKDAWRNDTMHPKKTYTEEEAESIFRAVKDFMQPVVKLRK